MGASFCSPCPTSGAFSRFLSAFSSTVGHQRFLPAFHAPLTSFSLSFFSLSCSQWGITNLFLLLCPDSVRFSLFFPGFSSAAGHQGFFLPPMPRWLSQKAFHKDSDCHTQKSTCPALRWPAKTAPAKLPYFS